MASFMKSTLAKVGNRRSSVDDAEANQEADKYKLQVTAGPSYDKSTHQTIFVNSGRPVFVENEFIRAKVQVRIRGYHGLPSSCPPSSPYFDDPAHHKDLYSIAFSFVPKQDLPSEQSRYGNDFDHAVRDRLPPGFNTAFKIVKEFIDPGLQVDAYADEPWLYGPSLSCWFAFRVGDKIDEGQDFTAPDENKAMEEGGEGSGTDLRKRLGIPANSEKRRKHFLDAKNRAEFVFEKNRVYQADFFNPFIDFGNFSLKLPGFSLNVIKYVDGKSHTLRYVFKNVETGDLYFNVNFNLLWGEELEKAVANDKQERDDETKATESQRHQALNDDQERENKVKAAETQQTETQNGDQKRRDNIKAAETQHHASQNEDQHANSHGESLDKVEAFSESRKSEKSNTGHDKAPQSRMAPQAGVKSMPRSDNAYVRTDDAYGNAGTTPSTGTVGGDADEISDLLRNTATADKRDGTSNMFDQ